MTSIQVHSDRKEVVLYIHYFMILALTPLQVQLCMSLLLQFTCDLFVNLVVGK